MSHKNEDGHPSAVFILLVTAMTAMLQIMCLNQALELYDSTLIVAVFYGVYITAEYVHRLFEIHQFPGLLNLQRLHQSIYITGPLRHLLLNRRPHRQRHSAHAHQARQTRRTPLDARMPNVRARRLESCRE
jgi:hypothetical protein